MRLQNLLSLRQLLRYHMLGNKVLLQGMQSGLVDTLNAGSQVLVIVDAGGVAFRDGGMNTARVTIADMSATNGIVHAIDSVLVPPDLARLVRSLTAKLDITAALITLPQFSELVSLFNASDLMHYFSVGSHTIFAPTNDAFAKLPSAFLGELRRPENKPALRAMLNYHALPQEMLRENFRSGMLLTRLAGAEPRVNNSKHIGLMYRIMYACV